MAAKWPQRQKKKIVRQTSFQIEWIMIINTVFSVSVRLAIKINEVGGEAEVYILNKHKTMMSLSYLRYVKTIIHKLLEAIKSRKTKYHSKSE